jgi:hypothetical protein
MFEWIKGGFGPAIRMAFLLGCVFQLTALLTILTWLCSRVIRQVLSITSSHAAKRPRAAQASANASNAEYTVPGNS